MTDFLTLWPDDGRRQRARDLMEAAFSAAADLPPPMPPYLILRELRELSSADPNVWALQHALGSIDVPTDAVVRAVERGVADYSRRQVDEDPPRRHKYYIPMEMVLDRNRTKPTQFYVLGKRFFLRSKRSVQREFDRDLDERLLIPMGKRNRQEVPPTIITCTATVRRGGSGWERVISGPFHVLRGLLELVTSHLSRRSLVESEPCAAVPAPQRIMWITPDDSELLSGGKLDVLSHRPAVRPTLNQHHFDRIRSLSDSLTAPADDDSTADTVAVALQLYAAAMDAHFEYTSFLALWQCMETLTLPRERGGGTREITSRANWILRQNDGSSSGYPKTLKSMARIRNRLVHTGRRGLVDPEDVNVLMGVVERLLDWYLLTAVHDYEKRYDLEGRLLRVS